MINQKDTYYNISCIRTIYQLSTTIYTSPRHHCYRNRGGLHESTADFFPPSLPRLYRAGNLHCTKTMKGSNDHYQKRYAFSGRKSIRSRVYGRIPVARPVVTGVDDSHPLDHAGGAKATMITHTQPRLVTPGDRNYTTGIPWTRTPWWPIQPPEFRDNSATTNCRAVQTNAYYPRFGEQFWILCGASFRWPLVLTLFLQSSLFLWDRRRLNLLEEEIFQGLFVSFDLEFNKFWNIYGRGTWRYKNRGNLIIGGSSKRSLWN